jgi:hypothetical protein
MALIRHVEDPSGHPGQRAVMYYCPACECGHGGWSKGGGVWSWDGNEAAPTLSPSMLVDMERAGRRYVCHSVITAGVIEFLSDCTHALAGQRVPMVEF